MAYAPCSRTLNMSRKSQMSQSLSQLWIHIIFSTKDRFPYLNDETIRQSMHEYLNEAANKLACKTMVVGGVEDHVHILLSLNKQTSLSKLIEKLKTSSSQWIKRLETSDYLLEKFYWQNGYGAFSVSQSNVDVVASYIKNQQRHHQKFNFQDELRKILRHHQVAYDERYLWN